MTRIGNYAFQYCSSLTSVTIPNTVTSIGNWAFSTCGNLTSITIPNSVTFIGDGAFCDCRNLTSITIPNSVTSIGERAFYANGLTSIVVASGNATYDSRNNCNAIIETTTNTLIAGCPNTIIPNSVTSIGNSAFYLCYSMTSVVIGNSVTSIGNSAFYGCSGLTSITIPNSVTSIGERAFDGCRSLTSITIPNSVTSIGNSAFYNCRGLTSITIPDSVTTIGSSVFGSCTLLDSIVWNAMNCSSISPFNDISTQITSFVFGDSVQTIPDSLCFGMAKLSSITIPENTSNINSNTFSGCTGLDNVIWKVRSCTDFTISPFYDAHDSIVSFTFGDRVQHIPSNLCNGMNRLKEMTIPASVETIGDNAFFACDSLTRVDISGLAPWSQIDFISCSAEIYVNGAKPTILDIPEGVTRVGAYAFRNCSQVTTIVLPSSVTEIGESAFANGSRLQTITLDAALETIGDSAFNNCPYLLTINANMAFPPIITSSVFANCGLLSGIDCYVPQGSLALYRKTTVWSSFYLHELATSLESAPMNNNAFPKKDIQNSQLYILLPSGHVFDSTGKRIE